MKRKVPLFVVVVVVVVVFFGGERGRSCPVHPLTLLICVLVAALLVRLPRTATDDETLGEWYDAGLSTPAAMPRSMAW